MPLGPGRSGRFRRRLRLTLSLMACCALLATATAQRFVFVSTRAPEADFVAYDRPWQSEVFAYRNGSEIRLTFTTGASEYDPVPSPDGRLVAYVALDHADEAARDTWGWYLGVVDALTAKPVARWPLPNTVGTTRPSGGFQPTWVGKSALLVQAPAPDFEWHVLRFELGEPSPRLVTTGFGIVLSEDGSRLATERADGLYLVALDQATGPVDVEHLGGGTPLAWWGEQLFVAQVGELQLLDLEFTESSAVSQRQGYYAELRVNPSGTSYAYVLHGDDGSDLVVADGLHQALLEYDVDGWLSGLDWLDDERLVAAREAPDGDVEVLVLDLEARGLVVNSVGVDHSPRALP